MRARVLASGYLAYVVIIVGLCGISAAISPYSLMSADLASFGFPASILGMQGHMPQAASSPESIIGFTSGLLPSGADRAAFNSFLPGMSGSYANYPAMSGLGAFGSPLGYASQFPLMSSLAYPGFGMPSMDFQPTVGVEGTAPSAANNYSEASNGKTITVSQGDNFYVQLPARVDQGFTWNLSTSEGLNVTATRVYPPQILSSDFNSGNIALQAVQEWNIKALEPGEQHVTASYKRSTDGPGDKTYTLTVIVV